MTTIATTRGAARRARWAERFPRLWCRAQQSYQPWVYADTGDADYGRHAHKWDT
jgi:hypothetical protein